MLLCKNLRLKIIFLSRRFNLQSAQFKYIFSFLMAIAIALTPILYQEIKSRYLWSNIDFKYYFSQGYGASMISEIYPLVCTTETLVKKFHENLKRAFRSKSYTVEKVYRQSKVQITIEVAEKMLKEIHEPAIKLIDHQYLAIFSIDNKSNEDITIETITITTDDAYINPLAKCFSTFPNSLIYSINYSNSSSNGYIVSFTNRQLIIPPNNNFCLVIAFHVNPFIKYANSFVTVLDKNCKKSIKLTPVKYRADLKIHLDFIYKMILTFLIVLVVTDYLVRKIKN